MARARKSRGKKWGPHKRGNKLCKKCGRAHSSSEHWSHAARGGAKYNFDQTPQPKGRKTAAGNPSRAVVPGKRRPKGMTKAEAKRQRKALAAKSAKPAKRAKKTAGRRRKSGAASKAKAPKTKKRRSAAQNAATAKLVARNKGKGGRMRKAPKARKAPKTRKSPTKRGGRKSGKTSGAPRTPWST